MSIQNVAADAAMKRIWAEWFRFYHDHFRETTGAISAADQMAFYEIAQPILRDLARPLEAHERPLTAGQLGDALGCFWNAALGAAHSQQEGMAVASVMAEGFAAVQARLLEFSAVIKETSNG